MSEQTYYYTYILASRTHVLYTGVTNNLERRLLQHRSARDSFSARYRCERLLWFERHSDAVAAITREKQIKGWTRAKKVALIEQSNRTWIDLSQEWNAPLEERTTATDKSKATAGPSLRSG